MVSNTSFGRSPATAHSPLSLLQPLSLMWWWLLAVVAVGTAAPVQPAVVAVVEVLPTLDSI